MRTAAQTAAMQAAAKQAYREFSRPELHQIVRLALLANKTSPASAAPGDCLSGPAITRSIRINVASTQAAASSLAVTAAQTAPASSVQHTAASRPDSNSLRPAACRLATTVHAPGPDSRVGKRDAGVVHLPIDQHGRNAPGKSPRASRRAATASIATAVVLRRAGAPIRPLDPQPSAIHPARNSSSGDADGSRVGVSWACSMARGSGRASWKAVQI